MPDFWGGYCWGLWDPSEYLFIYLSAYLFIYFLCSQVLQCFNYYQRAGAGRSTVQCNSSLLFNCKMNVFCSNWRPVVVLFCSCWGRQHNTGVACGFCACWLLQTWGSAQHRAGLTRCCAKTSRMIFQAAGEGKSSCSKNPQLISKLVLYPPLPGQKQPKCILLRKTLSYCEFGFFYFAFAASSFIRGLSNQIAALDAQCSASLC